MAVTGNLALYYIQIPARLQVFSAEELCVVMCREDGWLMRDVRCEDVLENPNTVFFVRQPQVCLTGNERLVNFFFT